ncbi:hypothetical protein BJ970_000692 [Saccharopolyspora phatthalungensis]|uniref:Uncharacterized protein n=1 Tax=Saccharopolyspora phatthalungensis TaxID=664693 RepID=A0A840Q331_9PSEU|nr:hypothetical protein [Saccharopolyspora phatthalungensis]
MQNALCSGIPDVPGVPIPELGAGWSLRPVRVDGADGGPDVALVLARRYSHIRAGRRRAERP